MLNNQHLPDGGMIKNYLTSNVLKISASSCAKKFPFVELLEKKIIPNFRQTSSWIGLRSVFMEMDTASFTCEFHKMSKYCNLPSTTSLIHCCSLQSSGTGILAKAMIHNHHGLSCTPYNCLHVLKPTTNLSLWLHDYFSFKNAALSNLSSNGIITWWLNNFACGSFFWVTERVTNLLIITAILIIR